MHKNIESEARAVTRWHKVIYTALELVVSSPLVLGTLSTPVTIVPIHTGR